MSKPRVLNSARAIRKAYEEDKLTCQEIASITGQSLATTWRRLRAAGVNMRARGSTRKSRVRWHAVHPYYREEIARRFLAGERAMDLAIEFAISLRLVYWARDQYLAKQQKDQGV